MMLYMEETYSEPRKKAHFHVTHQLKQWFPICGTGTTSGMWTTHQWYALTDL